MAVQGRQMSGKPAARQKGGGGGADETDGPGAPKPPGGKPAGRNRGPGNAYAKHERPTSGRDPRFHSPNQDDDEKPRKRRKKKKKTLMGPAVLIPAGLVIICLAYAGFWLYAAKVASQGVSQWIQDRRAEGYAVSHRGLSVGGFPLNVALDIKEPSIEAPESLNSWSWSAPLVQARVNPFSPSTFTLRTTGAHSLAIPLGQGQRPTPLQVTFGQMSGLFEVGPTGRFEEIDAKFRDTRIEGLPIGPVTVGGLAVHTLTRALYGEDPEGQVTWSIQADLRKVDLPPKARLGLGKTLNQATLDARLFGFIPPGPIYDGLKEWRDEAGALRVDALTIDWAPLNLNASGSLGLDDDLQPNGGLTAQVAGLFTLIEGMGKQGLSSTADASMAAMMLSGVVKERSAGGNTQISVPLTINRRSLFAGPAELIALPTINWGGKGPRSQERIRPGFEIDRDGSVVRDGDRE